MTFLLSFALMVLQSGPVAPKVEVQPLGQNRHRIVITGLEEDDRISQAAAAQVATQVCGTLSPSYGRFEATRSLKSAGGRFEPARFAQEIDCVAAPVGASSGLPTMFTPDAAADQSARAAVTSFLADFFGGRAPESWRRLTAGMRDQQSLSDWTSESEKRLAIAGKDLRTTIVKVSWYVDPPGVATGIYAAADFTGSSREAAALCGYVSLVRDPSGIWLVTRVESGTLLRKLANKSDPATLANVRAQLRCVEG